jgi:hypothetical protein
MTNEGPGVAVDVTVELDCGVSSALALETDELRLGDIPSRRVCDLVQGAWRYAPAESLVTMAVQVSWNELASGEQKSIGLRSQAA